MPLVDERPRAGATGGFAAAVPATVSGWGARDRVAVSLLRADGLDALRAAVLDGSAPAAIARGMGRSYGDAAQLSRGLVLDTTGLDAVALDAEHARVRAEAGVTLARLLMDLAPAGWTLPVVPGTQHVTLGGAIAADIHGKNHGAAGTFGAHVRALGLMLASGEVVELSRERERELFLATLGGMGLTGVIVWAEVRLRRVTSQWLSVDVDRVQRLDDALALLDQPGGEHRVAWLDLLGAAPVRGVVTRAAHLDAGAGPSRRDATATVSARLTVPARWPGGVLRADLVRAYNAYRFHRTPRRAAGRPEPFGAHMFPLDVVGAWPRLYGAGGLVQYQLVVPKGEERALEAVIAALRRASAPCFLAVLKDLGPAGDAPLSFPIAGWTLALDFPGAAPRLSRLLDAFDELVAGAGGRVYLAKDARLRAETLAVMYPRLDEWRVARNRADPDGRWLSDLGLRTGLVGSRR
jgi:decaprenylphospho-beta-D-ribofuranose 2-oxidase